MTLNTRKLMQRLIDLQIQAEKIDETLKIVRIEINNIFWNIRELKQKNIIGR